MIETKKPSTKSAIKTGSVDIAEAELDFARAKVKLSIWIDGDILLAARKQQMESTGSEKGYQTLINSRLREVFLGPDPRLSNIESRLILLEKVIAKANLG